MQFSAFCRSSRKSSDGSCFCASLFPRFNPQTVRLLVLSLVIDVGTAQSVPRPPVRSDKDENDANSAEGQDGCGCGCCVSLPAGRFQRSSPEASCFSCRLDQEALMDIEHSTWAHVSVGGGNTQSGWNTPQAPRQEANSGVSHKAQFYFD